jgi:hypothetical protein
MHYKGTDVTSDTSWIALDAESVFALIFLFFTNWLTFLEPNNLNLPVAVLQQCKY